VRTRHGVEHGWWELSEERRLEIRRWLATFVTGDLPYMLEVELVGEGQVQILALRTGADGQPMLDAPVNGELVIDRWTFATQQPPPPEWWD